MALKQVGARIQGDVFQGLFFWGQAADLLLPNSLVERVDLEHDQAGGVDDVAVFYREPGVNAGGWHVTADFYQLKYHVDHRDSYSSDAMVDPGFINAKTSLLERFFEAYDALGTEHQHFRLHLASNWQWNSDDKLARLLRERDGELPHRFFEDGPGGDLGKIREKWRSHLDTDVETFTGFAKALRLQLNHFGRRNFKDFVYAKLALADLRTPSPDRSACPYDSLVQQFLMSGQNSFDRNSFRELCEREGLLVDQSRVEKRPTTIGVRSFIRFAERLESEVEELVCVAENFEGRHPTSESSWNTSALRVLSFLGDPDRRARLRATESAIALECHGSLALLAGWELSRNSGVDMAPIQKPNLEIWKPTTDAPQSTAWSVEVLQRTGGGVDIALCLSVTHDLREDVEEYLASEAGPPIARLVIAEPDGGPSPLSVKGAGHAYALANSLPKIITEARPTRQGRVHVFFGCPNALMFFIGQQREALGRLALYEFDFSLERNLSYEPSLLLPISSTLKNETEEVPSDFED